MSKIKELYTKHREIILYFIFGGLTTLVSIASFWVFDLILTSKLALLSNFFSLVITVTFAYIVNKLFVFESKSWQGSIIRREIAEFICARLLGFGIEEGGLLLFVNILGFGDKSMDIWGFTLSGALIVKAVLTVIVIILNYFFSKFIIFKRKK